jgi:hypothetical protein
MNTPSPQPIPEPNPAIEHPASRRQAWKREAALAVLGFTLGFVVLPLLIFIVGTVILGPYAGGKSAGAFFTDFYTHLTEGTPRTWLIALAPYMAIWLVRLCFRPYFRRKEDTAPTGSPPESPAQVKPASGRREPFISA